MPPTIDILVYGIYILASALGMFFFVSLSWSRKRRTVLLAATFLICLSNATIPWYASYRDHNIELAETAMLVSTAIGALASFFYVSPQLRPKKEVKV